MAGKSVLKSDFAEMYYGISRETLRRWINKNPLLLKELKAVGYNKYDKMLTPIEIRIIKKYYG